MEIQLHINGIYIPLEKYASSGCSTSSSTIDVVLLILAFL